jgi:hypothetical protein
MLCKSVLTILIGLTLLLDAAAGMPRTILAFCQPTRAARIPKLTTTHAAQASGSSGASLSWMRERFRPRFRPYRRRRRQ